MEKSSERNVVAACTKFELKSLFKAVFHFNRVNIEACFCIHFLKVARYSFQII
jgi:hypothetical protein